MKHDKHDMQPTVSARRRLIRGAFAAPALLTLHSGSARAASSLGMCLVKANTSPATFAAAGADDTTFRYQLYTVRDGNNIILSSWIKGSELIVYVRAGQQPFVPSGSWQKFDPATNQLVDPATTTTPTAPSGGSFNKNGSWVSLRVSSTGAIVGAGGSGGGSGVGDSCWNSFAAGTA